MTPEQRDLARHALGLPNAQSISFRNHFVTGEDDTNRPHWMDLVEAGLAKRLSKRDLFGGDDLFKLTYRGARLALDKGERLDPEDFPIPAVEQPHA